ELVFVTAPLKESLTINGSFEGNIQAIINKKDMDLLIGLYEQLPNGKYHYLSYYLGRASYANNRSKRTLLRPGVIESIPIQNTFFTSRKIAKGNRLVVTVSINKSVDWEINYGTGKPVNTETIQDAKQPLQIQWSNQSVIKIPVFK
ncbi:MAG: CocE/NonD family hydrolase C-terminal non-catalytic domain-containing protein, partial [Sediminibacterium sp.]|nr:CocE/NonD family hydrolase C-terminal non-catalytic domain-containing protein [Sediminibacterium sp.]